MKTYLPIILTFCVAMTATLAVPLDTAKIDQLTGLKGKFNQKEGVYKVTFPRNDVKVAVDRWTMPPFMGLGTWAAFTPTKDAAMVMGDTVLFEDEVNAAMSAALDNGLSVTALHNHFFFDHPKVYFMHIEGEGGVDQLATAVRKVYDAVRQVRVGNAQPRETFGANPLPEKNSISTTDDFLPLLGPRPRKRFGRDDQRRVFHRRFAGSQLAQVRKEINRVKNL